MSAKGKAYIVGAGPGDLGLVTMKAVQIIETADVILYDELANSSLLRRIKKGAELVYVGKKSSCHSLPQEEISKKIVEYAKQGKNVCRLKGGDPFIFGRGGEEIELLTDNGIEYEVVPGISSAIAAPAYAGIPITQRGLTSGLAIFTGHEDPTKPLSDLNWDAIAKLGTTLVFLMGMSNLSSITSELMKRGMSANTPVAIVHRGTTPKQKTLIGTLKTIPSIVDKEGIGAPSVIVVGKVVDLHEKLSWFEKKPLFGKKIIVTRSRKQASKLALALEQNGAEVYEIPTIEIVPNKGAYPKLDVSISKLKEFEWVIFTSANSVEIFFDRLKELKKDARVLGGVKVCAIGPATRDEISKYFVNTDLVPEKYIAESIFESLRGKVKGKKILLPRSDIARKDLLELLTSDGAIVEEVPIYKTITPNISVDELKNTVSEADLVTFTSSSTADNFAKLLGSEIGNIKAASIGPITTKTIKTLGIKLACEAKEFTIDGLVEAIVGYFKKG